MDQGPITRLLKDFSEGDKSAFDRLMPLVYDELRRLASGYLRNERAGHTLQPTALVHEAYTRLLQQDQCSYRSRTHFLAVAARAMRQILIDHSRLHRAGKRDLGRPKLALEEACASALERPAVMIALSDALDALERKDAAKARLIELRYFGGLTLDETAEATGCTVESVRHQLRVAQAFLHRELAGGGAPSAAA